jgi:hypothetical protein
MTTKQSSVSRRKLLKALSAAGGATAAVKALPERWTRPIVDSVEIPVHAQGSVVVTGLAITTPLNGATIPAGTLNSPFNVLVTPPVAGVTIGVTGSGWIVVNTPSPVTNASGIASGTFNVTGLAGVRAARQTGAAPASVLTATKGGVTSQVAIVVPIQT